VGTSITSRHAVGAPLGPNSTDLNKMSAADLDVTGRDLFYDR
jgi:hypothetical protein